LANGAAAPRVQYLTWAGGHFNPERGSLRQDLGLLQMKDDPNNILSVWAVGDVARATAFFDSPALAAHMINNAGVVGSPERHFWKA
jgi:hypothetical protein